jgi:hypothetical protein
MILGFTGTRNVPTVEQLAWLWNQFDDVDVLHNGACVGADLASHKMALGHHKPIIVHPPVKEAYLASYCLEPHPLVTVLARKPYGQRNHDIVNACNKLIALPDGPRRPHSGTWHTIDYAKRMYIPVTICWPDGEVTQQ